MTRCERCGTERKLYHPCPKCGEPTFVGEVHVDWDSPNVIRTGESSFILVPDERPATPAVPLGDDWQDVGFTTDEGVDTPFGRFDVP